MDAHLPQVLRTVTIAGRAHYVYDDGTVIPVISGGDGTSEDDASADGDGGDTGSDDGADESAADDADDDGAEGDDGDEDNGDEEGESDAEAFADLPAVDLEADEADLRAAYGDLDEQFNELRANDPTGNVEVLREIRRRQHEIADELARRNDAAEAAVAEIEALDADEIALPEPVTASATAIARARRPQSRRERTPSREQSRRERTRVAMLGGSGQQVVAEGAEIDLERLALAADEARSGRGTGRTMLASIPGFSSMPDAPEPLSSDNSTSRNDALIAESNEEWEARQRGETPHRVAAICGPGEIIREIPDCATAASPVADIFPSRPAGRLSFTFTASAGLADVAGAVTYWTETDQAEVDPDDPDTWKPCIEIDCPETDDARPIAIPGCVIFDNTTEMSSPERVRNIMNLVSALRARRKDQFILNEIDTISPNIPPFGSGTFGFGTLPVVVEAIVTALAQGRFANRLEDTRRELIVEPALIAAIAIDQANRAFGNICDQAEAEACLREFLADYGVGLTVTLDTADGLDPFQAFTAGIALPSETTLRLVTPQDAIYFETGELNVGITRDSRLLRQNKAQWFAEEYVGLARHGCNPWLSFDIALCPSGLRAGVDDSVTCVS